MYTETLLKNYEWCLNLLEDELVSELDFWVLQPHLQDPVPYVQVEAARDDGAFVADLREGADFDGGHLVIRLKFKYVILGSSRTI